MKKEVLIITIIIILLVFVVGLCLNVFIQRKFIKTYTYTELENRGYTAQDGVHIDTENAEVRNIDINEKECILVVKNNITRVYWTSNEMAFFVVGNIDENEIIEIIKNIE